MVVVLASLGSIVLAADTENGAADEHLFALEIKSDGSAKSVLWRNCVARRVVAEGVAWGGSSKPYRSYVVLDGDRIFVSGQALSGDDTQGRLVHVSGILRVAEHPPTPPGSQPAGYGKFYFIEVESVKVVALVEHISMRVAP